MRQGSHPGIPPKMPKYKMNAKGMLQDLELSEVKAIANNSTRWEPEKSAANISRSLNSLNTTSYYENSTKSLLSQYTEEESLNSSFFDSYNRRELLEKLDPSQSLPSIPLPAAADTTLGNTSGGTSRPSSSPALLNADLPQLISDESFRGDKKLLASSSKTTEDNCNNNNNNDDKYDDDGDADSLSGYQFLPGLLNEENVDTVENEAGGEGDVERRDKKETGEGELAEKVETVSLQDIHIDMPGHKQESGRRALNCHTNLDDIEEIPPDYDVSVRPNKEFGATSSKHPSVKLGVKMWPDGDTSNTGVKSILKKKHDREKRQKEEIKTYSLSTPPEDLKDLSKLSVLKEDTINTCIQSRYKANLIYTRCGGILISVNPFKDLGIYTQEKMKAYTDIAVSDEPHLYMISAKSYQDLRANERDQVILVSGESGAGKTEATKLLVQHLISLAGSDSETLQDTIIKVNPLLENFGNAKTVLNNNSSRFAKFLRLNYNHEGIIHSARIQDFMLEKSRVVHYDKGETTFHCFYALLAGYKTPNKLHIDPEHNFRITKDFRYLSSQDIDAYKEKYKQQMEVFHLLDLTDDEIEDVHVIMAAILHIADIEFSDADDDCVNVKNEDVVAKVADLLDLDREKLTQALIQRIGKTGKDFVRKDGTQPASIRVYSLGSVLDNYAGDIIHFSKRKTQADDERDAFAKTLYEKIFGWLVLKINEALTPAHRQSAGSIGILDVCGFEDLRRNSFEQLCINIINEHLQNFVNKRIIDDERQLYEDEGVSLGDIGTGWENNDTVLDMFMKKRGILASIDEDSKHEHSADDVKAIRKLDRLFIDNPFYKGSISDRPEFTITHFAGSVKYDGESFMQKNRDVLGDLVIDCLKKSKSLLVQDMFEAPPSFTGSISMSQHIFQGSKRGGLTNHRPLTGALKLSQSINKSTRDNLKSRFGQNIPNFKSDFSSRKTHIHYFKNSLNELKRNMDSANPYFVRCIKPNDYLKPGNYNANRVLDQLRYNGITEIARIRSCGLPVRMVKSDFVDRYGDLVPDSVSDHVANILKTVDAQPDSYKIGISQVFITTQLESFLNEDLADFRRKKKEEEEERKRIQELKERKEKEERERQQQKQKADEERKKKQNDILERRKRKEQEEIDRKNREQSESLAREVSFKTNLSKSVNFQLDRIEEGSTGTSDESLYNKMKTSGPGSSNETFATHLGQSSLGKGDGNSSDNNNDATPTTSFAPKSNNNNTGNGDEEKKKAKEEESDWKDYFQDFEEEIVREDIVNLRTLKIIKVFLYIFLALLLLTALVVQKVSFVTLAMKLRKGTEELQQRIAYFMLLIVICIPYAVGAILSLFKLLFGIAKSPSVWTWFWVIAVECLHSFGMCILVFRVMPDLNYFKAAYMLSATAVIPSFIKLIMSDRKENVSSEKQAKNLSWKALQSLGFIFDLLAFAVQASSVFFIKWLDFYQDLSTSQLLELVGALVLVSVNQWENFADGTLFGIELHDESYFKNKVLKVRFELQECRHFPNMVTCVLKIGLTVLLGYLLRDDIDMDYEIAFDELYKNSQTVKSVSAIVAVTISAFVAFVVSLLALKLQMQRFSFALPLCLATPATVAVLFTDCRFEFLKAVTDVDVKKDLYCKDELTWVHWYHLAIFGGGWLLSLLVVVRHIWKRQLDKNSNMNRLFLNPFYCGILTAEQIMLNQRRHQCKINFNYKLDDNDFKVKSIWYKFERLTSFTSDGQTDPMVGNNQPNAEQTHVTPKIYACATMWHEIRTEMVQLLKSLHRLDFDQYLRKSAQRPDVYDPNYYEYEAHIFFDDAMELDDDNARVPNKWVKELVGAMSEACSSVHGKPMKVSDPCKMATPYGGQLLWRMPGNNLLFVHLKDMSKIRNRKRWSQVMYMYYLLHYRMRMFCTNEAIEQMEAINKEKGELGLNVDEINMLLGDEHAAMSNKTFILALDGDTDFNPSAIRILMQRMDEANVGATCGRIHPIGKGPLVWYQKFEYAIGHWLQKAAEHVFGCVLCSPGCFSLFRAKALMDTNVIKRYTTEPTEPGHHLQYDQGEDRWLCTLLLQRGYRIEYAAGADAWTFCPEGFFELYNQRRRWMPSTIANILDLLSSSDKTRRENANISFPYIMYTWLLMLMTLLGPGTILMMISGAFQLIFKLDIVEAYLLTIIPAVLYTISCFFLKSRHQLIIAAILSIVYAFVMMIVLVGTIITATTENIFHPSVIIMVLLVGIFTLTGACHPKEWGCLVHGFLYLMAIPSGYLLLVIFSICNLNDVSWGTREVPTKAQRLEMEQKKKLKEQEKLNKVKKSFFRRIFDSGEGHLSELTNFLKTVIPKNEVVQESSKTYAANQDMMDILKVIADNTKNLRQPNQEQESNAQISVSLQPKVTVPSSVTTTTSQPAELTKQGKKEVEDDSINPHWTQHLGKGLVIKANEDEIRFWKGLVSTYLKPIYPSKEEKKKTADGLRDLRNSAAFGFIIINALWMALNFMFQLTEAAKVKLSYKLGDSDYDVEESILGLTFVFVLLSLLLLQFVGMLIHRMGTLQQLLSTTKIWGQEGDGTIFQMSEVEDTMRLIRMVLRMPAINDEGSTEPPIPAEAGNPLGHSIRPSGSQFPMSDGLGQSLKNMGMILDMTRKNSAVIDKKSVKTLMNVRRRLEGTDIREKFGSSRDRAMGFGFGSSYRPRLPPRGAANNATMTNTMLNWGVTARDIQRLRPGTEVKRTSPLVDHRQMAGMGALDRSLFLRARIIQDEQAKLNADEGIWDNHVV